MKAERIWKVLAIGLAAAAVAASLNLWLSAPRQREILARKETDLRQVLPLQKPGLPEEALRARLDAQQAWMPADLNEVATRTLGAGVARIAPRPAVPAAHGWLRRVASVEIREAPLAEALLFLMAAAETPPAWRLREIEIRPSADAGKGGLTVVLEALEKEAGQRTGGQP